MTVAPDRTTPTRTSSGPEWPDRVRAVLRRPTAPRGDAASRPLVAALTAAAAVVAGLVVLVREARRIWFFGDDWNFLLTRSLSKDLGGALFDPHNEHWSTVPVLVYRTLYAVVGLRHFLPYMAPVLLAHVVVCAMVWVLSRRAGAAPWAAVAGVVLVAFAGVGAEDLLWSFQVGFVGSIAFGLLAVWAADHTGGHRLRDAVAVVAAVLAFASSGMGVTVWFLLVVLLLARRGWRATLVVGGIPLVVYAIWFLTYGRAGVAADADTTPNYLLLPQFVWRGLSTAWGGALGIPDAGPALVVLVAVATLTAAASTAGRHRGLRRLGLATVATSVLLYASIGVSRLQFGIEQATASRYAYPVVVFSAFGVAALLTVLVARRDARAVTPDRADPDRADLDRADRDPGGDAPAVLLRPPALGVALAVVLALVAVGGVYQLQTFATARATLLATSRPQILGTVLLLRDGAPVLTGEPDPVYSPDVTTTLLASRSVQAAFGSVPATPQVLLDARAAVQTAVAPNDLGLPAPAAVSWENVSASTPPSTSGCAEGVAVRGSVVDVTPDASGRAQVRLRGAGPQVQVTLTTAGAASTTLLRNAGPDVWIGTVAPDATVRVTILQDTTLGVCAGASAS